MSSWHVTYLNMGTLFLLLLCGLKHKNVAEFKYLEMSY